MAHPKAKKYFRVGGDITKNPIGARLLNEAAIKEPNRMTFSVTNIWRRGFSHFPNNNLVQFRHEKRLGRKPLDLELFGGFWLINERLRETFDRIDEGAFEYRRCTISFEDGSPTQSAWLCDVVRLVDCLDEEQSDVQIRDVGRKYYNVAGARRIYIDAEKAGNYHIFRLMHSPGVVICDYLFQNDCRTGKMKGIRYHSLIN